MKSAVLQEALMMLTALLKFQVFPYFCDVRNYSRFEYVVFMQRITKAVPFEFFFSFSN